MNKFLLAIMAGASLSVTARAEAIKMASPDGELVLSFDLLKGGVPSYSVDFKGKQVVAPSRLGLTLDYESGRNDFTKAAAKATGER